MATIKKNWETGIYKFGFMLAEKREIVTNILRDDWRVERLPNGYYIAVDPEVNYCCKIKTGVWVILCGNYCMDIVAGHMDFNLITETLADRLSVSEQAFLEYLDDLNGRFVCIYSFNNIVFLLNDAVGERSVYYSTQSVIVASHYNLVHDIVKTGEHPFWRKYSEWVSDKKREHKPWPWVMPGDTTPWAAIKILTPNHKLALPEMTIARFYPRQNAEDMNVAEATYQIARYIKKEAETLNRYFNIFQSLTAGSDTRITLAATRDIKNEINYFTYHDKKLCAGAYESEDREQNFNVAKKICDKEKLKFSEIIIPQEPLPDELNNVLAVNHYHRHIPKLLMAYSGFFPKHCMHLRSNLIEIIRGNEHAPLNRIEKDTDIGEYFSSLNGYSREYKYFKNVNEYFERYYFENGFEDVYDYPVSQLFFWEYRLGVWCSGAVLPETDLVVDTFQLFNCRKILDIGLRMPAYYRNRSILYDKVVDILWPDLLDYGLPNESEKIFNLINKTDIKNGQIAFNNRTKTVCGNLVNDKGGDIPFLYEPYRYGASIGFSGNKIRKGDFCGLIIDHKVEKNKNYFYQIQIKTSWVQGASSGISYELLINDKILYSLPINACYYINQIRCSFKAEKDKLNRIVIRVVAKKDIDESFYNSTIDIYGMELKREYGSKEYQYEPHVFDTFNTVNSKVY